MGSFTWSLALARSFRFFWKKLVSVGRGQLRLYECQVDTPPRRLRLTGLDCRVRVVHGKQSGRLLEWNSKRLGMRVSRKGVLVCNGLHSR